MLYILILFFVKINNTDQGMKKIYYIIQYKMDASEYGEFSEIDL